MGQIHAAKAKRSSRLSRVLDFLRRRGKEGATTREIIEACRVCAVNSIAAELRQNGFKISCTTKCLASGERVATYVLTELPVGVPA